MDVPCCPPIAGMCVSIPSPSPLGTLWTVMDVVHTVPNSWHVSIPSPSPLGTLWTVMDVVHTVPNSWHVSIPSPSPLGTLWTVMDVVHTVPRMGWTDVHRLLGTTWDCQQDRHPTKFCLIRGLRDGMDICQLLGTVICMLEIVRLLSLPILMNITEFHVSTNVTGRNGITQIPLTVTGMAMKTGQLSKSVNWT